MEDYVRIKQIEFNQLANDAFQWAVTAFRKEAANINRRGDENVYQMLRSKHQQLLRTTLEQKAMSFIARCDRTSMHAPLHTSCIEIIRYFESEFLRKSDEY